MVDKLAVEESFTSDELIELGCDLEKAKDDGSRALSILKVLEKKSLTADQLVDTKIGKKLSIVKEDYPDDVELAGDIKFFKDQLKKKWTAIYKNSKPKKEEALKQKNSEEQCKVLKIPFIGDSIHSYATGDDVRD